MEVNTFLFAILGLGLVAAQLASLRLLSRCSHELRDLHGGITNTGESLYERGSLIGDAIAEVNRIGADLADLLETLVDGQSIASTPASGEPVSVQDAIMQLIVGKAMAALDGSQTSEERAVHQQQTQETQNDNQPEGSETQE